MSTASFPQVCVALSGPGMLQTAEALLPLCEFFEFRMDTLDAPFEFASRLEVFLRSRPSVTALATCRRTLNGGCFEGTAQEEARVLEAAAFAGARIVDLSVESAEALRDSAPGDLRNLRHSPAALLVSWHDFAGTPNLEAVYARLESFSPAFLKIVPTAVSLDDALALLDLLKLHGRDGRLVAMSMGTPGICTRVLGPRSGSAWTFAAPDAEGATAPGQMDLRTLQGMYRVETISAATRLYGVFGKPVTGSKSPAMQNAAFAACGLDAVYLPLQTADAAELFRAMETLPLHGASVTMPLKEEIITRLQHNLDPLAEKLGAANTLVRTVAATRGHNTDAAGIVDPLARRISLDQAHVLVLGAGGAARAAVFALRAAGAKVAILNRSADRAQALAEAAGATVVTRQAAADARWDAIVQATPHGMRGQGVDAPLTAEEMNTGVFFDLVYNPLETPLLLAARQRGIEGIAGVEMFLAQGAAQFRLWTGEEPPLNVMHEAVLQALEGQ